MFPSDRRALAAVPYLVLALTVGLADAPIAAGENFRVENKVFRGDRKEPVSRSTTIFHEGVVYDYLEQPAEVIVFEKLRSRFVLLDTVRRVRAELMTDEVASFTRQLKQRAANVRSPYLRFLIEPTLDEQFDEAAGVLRLSSRWMTYRLVLLATVSRSVAAEYREFSDWYAQLNAMLEPRSRPPFARLLVNAALGKHEAIAREVELTLTPQKIFPRKGTTIRSQHRLVRQVAETDLDRIGQTRQFMEIFKPVSFEQYRRVEDR